MKVEIKFQMSIANVNTKSIPPKRVDSEKQFDSIYKIIRPLVGFVILYCLKIIISMVTGM
jgi:hypothetical protein